MVGLA